MDFITVLLKGFSQVFLRDNAVFGLIAAVGLAVTSPIAFLYALLGNIVAQVTALLLHVPKDNFIKGVYGFNGVLVGLWFYVFIKDQPTVLILTLVGSALTALIYHLLFKNDFVPLAIPFVVVVSTVLLFVKFFK